MSSAATCAKPCSSRSGWSTSSSSSRRRTGPCRPWPSSRAFAAELLAPTLIAAETAQRATRPHLGDLDGRPARLRTAGSEPVGSRTRDPRGEVSRTGPAPSNSPETFGHFGQSGTFVWIDPSIDRACVVVTDEAVRTRGRRVLADRSATRCSRRPRHEHPQRVEGAAGARQRRGRRRRRPGAGTERDQRGLDDLRPRRPARVRQVGPAGDARHRSPPGCRRRSGCPEVVASGREGQLTYIVSRRLAGVPLSQVWARLSDGRASIDRDLASAGRLAALHEVPAAELPPVPDPPQPLGGPDPVAPLVGDARSGRRGRGRRPAPAGRDGRAGPDDCAPFLRARSRPTP